MDQSASIFSRRSHVLNVGFVPRLIATLVAFPQSGMAYVIANTLVTSEKQKTAKFNYNLRVVEVRVVARILVDRLKLDIKMALPTLKHVMDAYFGAQTIHTAADFLMERQRRLRIMLDIVEDVFGSNREGDTWEQVYARLGGISAQDFKATFHEDFEIEAEELKLYKRAKHAVRTLCNNIERRYADLYLLIVFRSKARLPIPRATGNSGQQGAGASRKAR